MELQTFRNDTDSLLNQRISNIKIHDSERAWQDSQVAQEESYRINRLTYLTALAVPLSISSGILSMGGDFGPGNSKYWVFWAIAIPLSAAVFSVIGFLHFLDYKRLKKRKDQLKRYD